MAPPSNFASQAGLDALLRYKPQREALAELAQAAKEQYGSSVSAAQSEGQTGMQAAEAAIPATSRIFQQAGAEGGRAQSLVAPQLAGLAPGNPFALANANERAAGSERLASSKATALSDLQQRKVAASEIAPFGRQLAGVTLLKELQKLRNREQGIGGSEAASALSETNTLTQDAAKNALTERGQNLGRESAQESSRTSRENAREKNTAGPGGVKPLTTKEQDEGVSTLKAILGYAKTGVQHGESRAQLVARLSAGRPQRSIAIYGEKPNGELITQPDATHTKAIQHVAQPKVPAYKPNSLMSAALDVAEHGHVSVGVQHALEREGYDVRNLGLPLQTPTEGKNEKAIAKGLHKVGEAVQHALSGV